MLCNHGRWHTFSAEGLMLGNGKKIGHPNTVIFMLFRLDFAIIKAVIIVKPYLIYSHIWLNIKIIIATLVTNKNSWKKHIVPLFLLYRQIFNQFWPNKYDFNLYKGFFMKKMTQICQIWKKKKFHKCQIFMMMLLQKWSSSATRGFSQIWLQDK